MVKSVLIVDDDASMRALFIDILEDSGLTLRAAAGGAEAILMIEEQRPDLIVLDLSMPDGDGFSVLQFLRERSAFIPTIVATANDDMESLRRALELGAKDYIVKPFRNDQLRLRVSRLFGIPT